MRLITWNVARRVTRVPEMAAALGSRDADVVCLQEVTARSAEVWKDELALAGLPHFRWALAQRRHTVAIASRQPLRSARRLGVPWPDSAIAARIAGVEVHCVHVPNAANGLVKTDTLRAVRAGLARRSGPLVLAGDLNTPRKEKPDGAVVSFARDRYERLRPERGQAWDAAELGVVPGLRDFGFTDCFRALHGYRDREPSWVYPRWGGGYRLDHVFAGPGLEPLECRYHHGWREAGLSDHSALEVDLRPVGRDLH